MRGSRAKGRGALEEISEFYTLLATRSSLRLWPVRRRGGQCYAPTCVTVPTALTIHLFNVEKVFVAFLPVSQRAFWPKRFVY